MTAQNSERGGEGEQGDDSVAAAKKLLLQSVLQLFLGVRMSRARAKAYHIGKSRDSKGRGGLHFICSWF